MIAKLQEAARKGAEAAERLERGDGAAEVEDEEADAEIEEAEAEAEAAAEVDAEADVDIDGPAPEVEASGAHDAAPAAASEAASEAQPGPASAAAPAATNGTSAASGAPCNYCQSWDGVQHIDAWPRLTMVDWHVLQPFLSFSPACACKRAEEAGALAPQ